MRLELFVGKHSLCQFPMNSYSLCDTPRTHTWERKGRIRAVDVARGVLSKQRETEVAFCMIMIKIAFLLDFIAFYSDS